MLKYTLSLLVLISMFGCGRDEWRYGLHQSVSSAEDWAWPDGFRRNIEERQHFNIELIQEAAFAKDGNNEFRHLNLASLLNDPLFKQYAPNQPRNFHAVSVYMETSRALFGRSNSTEFPRQMTVIGTSVLGINTDSNFHKAYNSIEIIDVDPQTAKPDFYILSYENARPELTKNPPSCVGCHGRANDQRYIWQIYNRWPGMLETAYRADIPQRLGRTSSISFTVALFEMNLARIAKNLLANTSYLALENQVIAALLDCSPEGFGLSATDIEHAIETVKKRYYEDIKDLLDQLNEVGPGQEPYRLESDGTIRARTIINRLDPVRLGLLSLLFADTDIDIETWSISRDRGRTSYLFQSSGGIGLSRLAFYLVENSPNRLALTELIANVDRLSHAIAPKTPAHVCESLLKR